MTQQEAISVVEQWIQEHSLLAAHVVNILEDAEGAWRVQAKCSEAVWWRQGKKTEKVGEPQLID